MCGCSVWSYHVERSNQENVFRRSGVWVFGGQLKRMHSGERVCGCSVVNSRKCIQESGCVGVRWSTQENVFRREGVWVFGGQIKRMYSEDRVFGGYGILGVWVFGDQIKRIYSGNSGCGCSVVKSREFIQGIVGVGGRWSNQENLFRE